MFNQKAFTLIELLVVVLIIGVLAAIALPQYEIAVESSRASEAVSNISSIAKAVDIYKLSTGQPTDKFDDLDVNLPGAKISDTQLQGKYYTYTIALSGSGIGYEVIATRAATSQKYQYYIYYSYARSRTCTAKTEEARAICDKLCLYPTSSPSESGFYYCGLK